MSNFAQVIACVIDPIDKEAPFGQVREGILKIRAPVLQPRKYPVPLLSWQGRTFAATMDSPYHTILDPSEVELVRLGLSTVQWIAASESKSVNRFLGIVVIRREDGRYKRIGVFDHKDRGDLFKNPEGFYESRNSLEPWSMAWEKAEVKEITIL
jgi:hypothetical protein